MKFFSYSLTVVLAAAVLLLSAYTLVLRNSISTLQNQYAQQVAMREQGQQLIRQLQAQQEEVNKGNQSIQVGQAILSDLANLALKNDKIKQLLLDNGLEVKPAEPGAQAPAQAPAPAPAQ